MAAIDCVSTVRGNGPALFLIHGIGSRRQTWEQIIDALQDEFTCISYDLRGHGDSPLPDGPFGLDELVEDLEALARQARNRAGAFRRAFARRHDRPGLRASPIPSACCPWGC